MTTEEITSGGASWRKRALAVAGVAATVAAGGVVLASSADAAVTAGALQARTTIFNRANAAADQPLQATFTNTDATAGGTAGQFTIKITGVPVQCNQVTITSTGQTVRTTNGNTTTVTRTATNVNLNTTGGNSGTCFYSGNYTLPAATAPTPANGNTPGTAGGATVTTLDFIEGVNGNTAAPSGVSGGATGTLTQQAFFGIGNNPTQAQTVSTGTVTTVLSDGVAPKATGTTPTGGTFYTAGQSVNVITPGAPIGNVVINDQSTNPPTKVNMAACPAGQLGEFANHCYFLDNFSKSAGGSITTGVYYNELTGNVVFPGGTNTPVSDSYQIAELNNFGVAVVSPTAARAFSDVDPNSPFAAAILALASQNPSVIQGFADGTFRPTEAVSRQAFAHYLYTLAGNVDGPCSLANFQQAYPDVPSNSPFCKSITGLDAKNIIRGYSDGKYRPTADVSRQAIAAFIYRYYNYTITNGTVTSDAVCTSPSGFSDVTSSNPFCGDIEFLKSNGYSTGYSDGGFHPAANSSRQAVAQLLYKFELSSKFTRTSLPAS